MSNLLEFKKKVKEKIKNDEILKNVLDKTSLWISSSIERTEFKLYCTTYTPFQFDRNNTPVIDLDEEDLEYFKNKYFKKLDEELNNKISDLKKQYGTEQ